MRCCLVLLAIACGAPPRVHAPGDEYLRAVRIDGNRAIATAELEPALALHELARDGAAIDPIVLAADVARLTTAYRKRGFFAVTVTARVERDGGAQTAVFAIVEGRRATTRVEIAGLPPEVPAAEARALVGLADGDGFDYAVYDAAKLPLAERVEDAGYAHVELRAAVTADAAQGLAIARYEVVPGQRCTFGAIRIAATEPALEEAVRARLGFATGDRYSLRALAAAQNQIHELGRFSTVHVVPDRGGGPVIGVTVELAEASRHEVHAGGGYGFERETHELRARAGYSVVPASHPLTTAAADGRLALTIAGDETRALQPKVRGLVSLQQLDLWWPRLRGEAELGADYQTVEAYTWTGGHLRLGLGAPLGSRALQLRVGWTLEQLGFSGLDPALGGCPAPPECPTGACTVAQSLGLCQSQRLGAYQASLVADLRDNPIEPHRGAYLDLRAAAGTPLAGGELRYVQVTPELRGYVSLGALIVAARARVGAIFGDVPVTQRYYSGGTAGQRGFPERRLSPLTPQPCVTGAPCVIGGAGLIETGVELRRGLGALWSVPVGANVFLDGGDVTERPEQLSPANLYWAVGVGVWGKLVGDLKIRVDLGYRLNRTAMDPHATDGTLANLAPHLGVGEDY